MCVSPHSVSSSYTVWTSFVLRSTLHMLHKNTCVNTFDRGPIIVLPLFGHSLFQRCPHWFCTQNKTEDSTPTGDYCPSMLKSPLFTPSSLTYCQQWLVESGGLNAYTNAYTHTRLCIWCKPRTSLISICFFSWTLTF